MTCPADGGSRKLTGPPSSDAPPSRGTRRAPPPCVASVRRLLVSHAALRAHVSALAAVVLALGLRQLLDPWLGRGYPFITYFVAVGFAAAWGGRGPGLSAVFASAAATWLLAEPAGTMSLATREDRYGLLIFVLAASALVLLIDSRRRAVARALAHGELLRTTLASIGDAVITTDAQARITDLNAVAEQLTGWPRVEALGQALEEVFRIVDEESGAPAPNPALRALREGVIVGLANHTRLLARDGRVWPIDDSAAPIRHADGSLLGCVLVFREISARQAAEAALREQAAALAAANRRKEEFLATLAHELRNPLAPVKNALTLLRSASDVPADEALDMVERQVDTMVRLIDDLIDVSRIDRNVLTLKRDIVAVMPLLATTVDAVRCQAESAGIRLELSLPDTAPHADLDPVRFSQIVTNLLINAYKFTPRGGTVTLSLRCEDDRLVLAVRDTGIGIPPALIERVFDLYWQAGRPMEWAETGLGIGLALVKQIAQLHGGSIVAHSDGPGCGSEFVVELPVLVAAPATAPEATPSARAAASPRRVLVVDDNIDGAESLALLLSLAGHATAIAHDGPAAVARAREFGPDLILLDIGLPLMDGYAACRAIRELPGGRQMAIVALTGWNQDADRERSAAAGFDGHLVKPVAYDTLLDLMAGATPRA